MNAAGPAIGGVSPRTGVVRDDRYLEHRTQEGHPESLNRLRAVHAALDELNGRGPFVHIPPKPAEKEHILLAHSPEYFQKIAATAGRDLLALTPDTHASAGSFDAALLAAGGLIAAVEKVVSGELANAFAFVRPPGHHAERNRAMGFCLFNNVAVAAMFARRHLGLSRVLIVDWDVHHGNGTQHIFDRDNSVLFFSIHQYPHFPGTGTFTEVGVGKGEGYSINIPLGRGFGDGEYAAILERLLKPAAAEFAPELILVSAGFDIHASDPMGGMKVSFDGFAAIARSLMGIAAQCCGGRLVMTLEGGYNVKTLGECARATLMEMADVTSVRLPDVVARANRRKTDQVMRRALYVHQPFWKTLRRTI